MRLRLPKVSDIKNKTVLVRVDYNVPLKETSEKTHQPAGDTSRDKTFTVVDDLRLKASLKTIHFLQENGAKIVLMAHLGRPQGKPDSELSTQPIAKYLTEKLQLKTDWIDDCIGPKVQARIEQLQPRDILLLENTRFHEGEKKNDSNFARQLAALADIYINDAFSVSHRNHASTEGVTHFLPSFAGFHLASEVEMMSKLMAKPKRPFLAVVGGAKISDKIAVLENLLEVADAVLVGGGVANNFLKAEGVEVYQSYLQDTPADLKKEGVDYVALANRLIDETKNEKILKDGYVPLPKILYPLDVVAAPSPESTDTQIIDLTHGADGLDGQMSDDSLMYLDIGPKTTRLYQELIAQAQTVFWNGPMGYFEQEPFKKGTQEVAKAMAAATVYGTTTLIGGGDTLSTVSHLGLRDQYSYVSTAGGAGLLFLAGQELPALKPLMVAS